MTNKLRDELAGIIRSCEGSFTLLDKKESKKIAQAIIDHLAPTMLEVVEALEGVIEIHEDDEKQRPAVRMAIEALCSLSTWQEKGE